MTTMMLDPERIHKLTITDFLKNWHQIQHDAFPTIDGIMMLDDIVGFVGEEEFKEFGLPYIKEIYDLPASVNLFHNDADCSTSVKFYPEMGVHIYNPGIQMTINELKAAIDNKLTILGNIPPRDVLAAGSPLDVANAVGKLLEETGDHTRLILSCGGGMPPGVSTENINAFLNKVKEY